MIINKIVISNTAPNTKEVGWLLPLEDGTFKLRFYGLNGWIDAASGVQGPKGDTGPQGPIGPKGDKGDKGDTGTQGIQGEKGEKGDKGDTGPQGPAGQTGATGPQGPAGENGASVTAIEFTSDAEGNITGGTATLSDKSTIEITVTKSEG